MPSNMAEEQTAYKALGKYYFYTLEDFRMRTMQDPFSS